MIKSGKGEKEQANTIRKMLPGILVSALCVAVLIWQIDLQSTAEAFAQVQIWRLIAGFVVLVLALAARAIGWRVLMREQVSWSDSFSAIGIGYLFNQILPFRLGEVARSLVIGLRTPLSFWEAFPTVVVERIFDLAFLAMLLLGTLPFVAGVGWAGTAAFVSIALVLGGFGVLYAIVLNPGKVQGLFASLSDRWPKVRESGQEKIDLLLRGLSVLRRPGRFIAVLGWIGATWGLTLGWNGVVLPDFYPNPGVLELGFIVGIAAVGVAAPSTPGNLGVYEAAIWSAFLALSANPAQGLAFALATHGIYILAILVLGVIGLLRTKISLREIYGAARNRQTQV
ncbi:MAG: flippase-like domain-containing protein [Anaerolineales bacterium]|nr:flippase-like domain-containing protein [Anaerolineales bacterium]